MSFLNKTEEKKTLKRNKYKPPVVDDTPKLNYLFIITFNNGEQHRVRQAKSQGRPLHFTTRIMVEGSTKETVYYPPSMVKKIHWEEF